MRILSVRPQEEEFFDLPFGLLVVLDVRGDIVKANKAFADLLGRQRTDLEGAPLSALLPSADVHDLQEALSQLGRQVPQSVITVRLLHRDGSLSAVRFNLLFGESDDLIFGTGTQLTEQEALAEQAYRLLFESNPYPTWVYDEESLSFLEVNGAAETEYGYTRDEFLSMTIGDIRPIEDISRLHLAIEDASDLEGRQTWTHIRKDGTRRLVHVKARPITFKGRAARLVAVQDVTEQFQAQKNVEMMHAVLQTMNMELEKRVADRTSELMATNAELEAFCFSVSHDLRTPLRAIDGFSKVILEDYGEALDEAGKGYLARVRNASQRMSVLIDDLLGLSRVTRAELRREDVDLSLMVQRAEMEMRSMEPDRNTRFEIEPGVKAVGDPGFLRMLVDHLISNAWKFTHRSENSVIRFWAEPGEHRTTYHVQDDGVGFDMAYSSRLFKPFERLHSQMEFPGDGIGLATVQRIVMRHGGEVWATSRPGEGATFSFTLGE